MTNKNFTLRAKVFEYQGRQCHIEQCVTAKHMWKICDNEHTVLGYMIVYVDDAMIAGPTTLVETVFEVFQSRWKVKVTGVIPIDGVKSK